MQRPDAFDRLIDLYTSMNNSEVAKRWHAERANYPREVAPVPRAGK